MTEAQVESFRKMLAQLEALHQEMVAAAKKTPDKAISTFKVRFVNTVLAQARKVLGKRAPDIGFDQFDADDLPTASDASLIISQFVECAEKIRCENIARRASGVWYWRISGGVTEIVTAAPKGTR